MAEDMSQRLGQLVVVDPRPGSAGVVAAAALLNAPADGYTIALLGTPPVATLPHLQRNLPYRVEQLQPVTNVIQGAFYLTVTADTPATNIRDLATITRRSPSPTLFVVVGIGSSPHLLMSVFARHSGANVEPVVYRSESLGAADMISGRVSMLMGTLVPVLDFAREGKLRILATTAPQRLGILPEVPTVAEAGFPEIEMVYWNGIFVSSQVPRHLVEQLNTALVTSMRSPAVIAAAAKVPELQLAPSTPEAFSAVVRRDRERLGGIIREYGITIE
ncbi:tripartite tricarboxylate transporter substrate binding protein [Belnapia sp. T18]|uniref:Tripartite tricarboxylate transporter substrate binding protein n=1 Tax=Belnapia arida TaxID=2804533 RepID=A0ABS1UA67_9PROT|nr:tripartite tricarboxylate transporter substrate binding protein [Belnapia arida]MBL6081573.1 tripartite tricarboxylate transporter substrate binding protein [Belnapia arida]